MPNLNRQKRPYWLLLSLLFAGLMAGCSPTNTVAPTAVPTTTAPAVATTTAPTVAPTTSAPTTTVAATTVPAAPTTARATTAPAAPTAAAPATTAAAPAATPALPPIGNNYPAGPAPTAAPPPGGLKPAQLQVPAGIGGNYGSRTLNLPPGFAISVYAQLSNAPRIIAFSPDNIMFVSEQGGGRVVQVRDQNGVGIRSVFAEGLSQPHGLAFHTVNGQTYLYVAETNRVTRFTYNPGQQRADKKETIVPNLPSGAGHSTRTIVFGTDGKMYVSVGSSCNVCEEADKRRAAVVQYNPDGTGEKVYAAGLRNGVGLAVNPTTGEIWETENSRDNLGDNMPPEEINILKDGAHYGWPYCVSNKVFDTDFGKRDQAFCDTTTAPALPMQAHSAPLGISFYSGQLFPADYQGSAFVGFHGSWNRSERTGYKVVRIVVENGRPTRYEDFITGWLVNGNPWGRPVHPQAGPDGNLYISDDSTNAIYKVTYSKPT